MSDFEILVSSLSNRTNTALAAYAKHKAQGDEHQLFNLSSAQKNLFQLGLLDWRRGDMSNARRNFSDCVEAYNRMVSDASEFASRDGFWEEFWEGNSRDETFPAAAAYLCGGDFTVAPIPDGVSRHGDQGYQPWFDSKLILTCMGISSFARDELNNSLSRAKNNKRYPDILIKLTEFHFEVLTGQWSDRACSEMLDQHSELYAGLKKLKDMPDLIHGEGDHNDRVVDWIFACILKRIGWSGRYLHAWPEDGQTAETGDVRETRIVPANYVSID
ncbi:hypothetical protein [Altererythrobacter sp. Z27]|uniref:hypothetical protein n=1 Tax=Altererythrobacter sp. Z27 TaxID=3461147 RepID=UPI004043B3F4